MSAPALPSAADLRDKEFLVVCLCADWCDICTVYRDSFLALGADYPEAAFTWVDIEDQAELVDDYEVENFPTVLIQRGDAVLFYGVLPPPYAAQLKRLIDELRRQTAEESRGYACATEQRRGWQKNRNLRKRLAAQT